jgi:hypothetical protein
MAKPAAFGSAFARLGASISRPGLDLRTEFTCRMVLWLWTMLNWSVQQYNFADNSYSPWHFRSWHEAAEPGCPPQRLQPRVNRTRCRPPNSVENGRVEMWRGGFRSNISVSAPFVWRCLIGSAVAPFPHLAHRTGHADLPHPALGQDFTPSPTTRRAQAQSNVRARGARKGARVDRSRPCVA